MKIQDKESFYIAGVGYFDIWDGAAATGNAIGFRVTGGVLDFNEALRMAHYIIKKVPELRHEHKDRIERWENQDFTIPQYPKKLRISNENNTII